MTEQRAGEDDYVLLVRALWTVIGEMQTMGHRAGDPAPTGYLSPLDAVLLSSCLSTEQPTPPVFKNDET